MSAGDGALGAFTAVATRSVLRIVRRPEPVLMTVVFPAVFLAIANASLGGPVASLPGFPADSYLQFAVAGTLVLSAVAAGVNAGADLASDLQAGIVDRVLLAPAGRGALLLGIVVGPGVLVAAQAIAYLLGLRVLGTDVAAGLPGAAALVVLVAAVAVAFAAVGCALALRTGSPQVVLASFPAFFVVMTFSSFFLPRALIRADWFRAVAAANPVSHIIEAGRSLAIEGWSVSALARGALVLAAVGAAAGASAERSLTARARGRR